MSTILIAVLVILAVIAFVLLMSIGLILFLGLGLVALVIGGAVYLFSGPSEIFKGMGGMDDSKSVIQSFNSCLLTEEPKVCREKWTTWGETENGFVGGLADQVKTDLGKRDEDSSRSSQVKSESINGEKTVSIDMETDFGHKKDVKEHYLMVSDKEGDMKIKEVSWNY